MNLHQLSWADLGETFDGPHATPKRVTEGPYFLNISSLSQGRLDLSMSDHVGEDDFSKWTKRVTPQENDLLFSYETRLGEAALMPAGVQACLGRRMALLRPDLNIVNPRFLLYYFLSPSFQRLIAQHTVHGATVPRISLKTIGTWPVSVPPLATQTAIAEVLGALDDKIAANTKFAQTFQDLGAARFQGLGLDSEPRESPAELDALFTVNPRRTLISETPTLVDMQALPTSQPLVSKWIRGSKKGGARFQNGDTLIARITPCLENRKTAFVDFLDDDEVGIGSTEFIVLRPHEELPPGLGYFLATSPRFREFAIQNMVGTSGRQRVSANDLKRHTLSVVPRRDLIEFGNWADSHLQVIGAHRTENRVLADLRDGLLPQLMSGKLRIKNAEEVIEDVI